MEARLTIQNGPQKGSSFPIRNGQLIRFGRTAWSDVAIPYDMGLADVHFSLETGARGVILTDLSRGKGTRVDGKPVKNCVLESNQKIQAGGLEFLIEIQVVQGSIFGVSTGGSETGVGRSSPPTLPDARKVCREVDLSRSATSLPIDGLTVDRFVESLARQNLWNDAWGVLAIWMGKPAIVGWTAREIIRLRGETLEPAEQQLLGGVQAWVAEPGAATADSLASLLENDDQTSAASWVALAAIWSGQSLTSAGAPVVAPSRGLTAKALNAAWNFLAAEVNPAERGAILGAAVGRAIESQKKSTS